jgi:cardiolipin synthase
MAGSLSTIAAFVPNLLTASRLILTPLIAWAILENRLTTALVIFALAGFTDAIDGPVARRLGVVSRAGAYLDPIADKVFVTVVYLCLAWAGVVPWWLVALVFTRDVLILAVAGAILLFTRIRNFRPSGWGKAATVVHVITIVVVMAGFEPLARILITLAGAITVWSGVHYAWRATRGLTE